MVVTEGITGCSRWRGLSSHVTVFGKLRCFKVVGFLQWEWVPFCLSITSPHSPPFIHVALHSCSQSFLFFFSFCFSFFGYFNIFPQYTQIYTHQNLPVRQIQANFVLNLVGWDWWIHNLSQSIIRRDMMILFVFFIDWKIINSIYLFYMIRTELIYFYTHT